MNDLRALAAAALTAFAVLTDAPSARGDFITGKITGQVISAGSSVPGITTGSLVSGSYTYDNSRTIVTDPGPANPLTAFSLTIGTNPFVFSLTDLESIGIITPGRVLTSSSLVADSLYFFFDFTVLSNYVGARVMVQSLPYTPPASPQEFDVISDPAHSFSFLFQSTSTAAVPEPSTITLLGLGCVTLAGFGWRRRNRSVA